MVAGRKRERAESGSTWFGWPELLILFGLFLVGILSGVFCAFALDLSDELAAYLREYCSELRAGEIGISFLSAFWDGVRWPALIALLSVTVLGVIGIPMLFLIRGFLLSFSVCAFGIALGQKGIAVAAVLFAVAILLVLPTMFVLGCHGLRTAYRLLPNAAVSSGAGYRIEILLVCSGILAVSTAILWTVIPDVLLIVCSKYSF